MTKTITLLGGLLLLLTACGSGGGGDSADEKTAKKNLSSSVREGAGADSPFTKKAADCFADGIVDDIGVEQLQEYGILDDKLTVGTNVTNADMEEKDADAAADAFTECVNFEDFFESAFGGADADPAVVDCLEKAIDEDKLHEIMKAGFMGDTEKAQEEMEPAMKCATEGMPSPSP